MLMKLSTCFSYFSLTHTHKTHTHKYLQPHTLSIISHTHALTHLRFLTRTYKTTYTRTFKHKLAHALTHAITHFFLSQVLEEAHDN